MTRYILNPETRASYPIPNHLTTKAQVSSFAELSSVKDPILAEFNENQWVLTDLEGKLIGKGATIDEALTANQTDPAKAEELAELQKEVAELKDEIRAVREGLRVAAVAAALLAKSLTEIKEKASTEEDTEETKEENTESETESLNAQTQTIVLKEPQGETVNDHALDNNNGQTERIDSKEEVEVEEDDEESKGLLAFLFG